MRIIRGLQAPWNGVSRPWQTKHSDVPRAPHCLAPTINLHFLPNGDVRTCSRSGLALGNIAASTIADIWEGSWRREIEQRLSAGDFSAGCQSCGIEFETDGREGSIAAQFDVGPGGRTALERSPSMPLRFDFMLSNACNLQCVQCHGDFSSAIRTHRERLPPMANPYGDDFVDQVADFLPGLEGAQFAGGEPFLVPLNFKIWDRVADVAPDLSCYIITNGTRWNNRVERTINSLRAHIVISLDGITKGTYESIRVGADLDQVLLNLDRFTDYTTRQGTNISINFCLMRPNVHELGAMLLFAEDRGIRVNVLRVSEPDRYALDRLPHVELARIVDSLEAQSADVEPKLNLNRAVWRHQIDQLQRLTRRPAEGLEVVAERVVMFRRSGRGWSDSTQLRLRLEAAAQDGEVHVADIPAHVLTHGCSSSLGPIPTEVLAKLLVALDPDVIERIGRLVANDVIAFDEDHLETRAHFENGEGILAVVASRNGSGWSNGATLMLALKA